MPLLTESQQAEMLGSTELKCDLCQQHLVKNYCRQCDMFFFQCGCPPKPDSKDNPYDRDHTNHRTY